MNANEIIVGKDYILKIAHNEVKVKVLSNVGHSWIIKTAGGKVMPVQNADRFVRPVDHVLDPVMISIPTEPQITASETATELVTRPATAPTSVSASAPTEPAVPAELVPVQSSVLATPTPVAPEKKLSMLDAAAQVLKTAGHPMKIQEILDAMQTAGLWKPGLGKTPDRTLISGFGTEIRRRVKNRFRKTAQGTFEYIGGDRHE